MTQLEPRPATTIGQAPVYSVVIPVYNSEESLPELVDRLVKTFQETLQEPGFEIVMVDDASTRPGTWATLTRLAAEFPQVCALQLMRNFGRHAAVTCGLHHARGKWVIVMDDDLQHRPEDIPRLAQARDHDIVIGAFRRKSHSLFKRAASRLKGWFDYRLAGKPRHILTSPFMLIRTEVVRAALQIRSPYPFVAALLFFVTRDVINVDVTHDPRKYGQSQFTLKKMIQAFAVLLLHNSAFLINAMTAVGAIVSVLSFGLGTFVIVRTILEGSGVPGWASLVALLSFQGGLILLLLGVIGEYLVRILNGIEQRPAYILRRKLPETRNSAA